MALVAQAGGSRTGGGSYQLRLAKDAGGLKESAIFSCYTDRVYAILKLPQKAKGKHLLEGKWYKPDGKIQEYTRIPLELSETGEDSVHIWLQFHLVQDVVDVFRTRTEEEEFDGDWTVDVFWDGKRVATGRFAVRCGL